ncbi:MAG TPA: response regulator [Chitinophagaceae bacterium]|nr:response regulator [Chitinophagaceae bacterium]
MKILLVEDDQLMLKTIILRLKKEGHDITSCTDGKEAIEQIENQIFDLIITDIMLPYVSGLEIVGIVKETTSTPIIVLSSMGQEKTIEEAFELGADDYITKPFNLTELSFRIKRFAKAYELQLAI